MAISQGFLQRDFVGFDSSADLNCSCVAQVRGGGGLLLYKLM